MKHDEAYAVFFRAEYPQVVRTVQMILQERQAAEDVAQDAFVRMFRHWRKVSRYDKPDAWIRMVAIRLAIKSLQRQRVLLALQPGNEPTYLDNSPDVDLMRAISYLPAKQRAAVTLFYLEDRPVSEIAEILDCSEATAKVHLHRARKRLGTILGELPEEVAESVV